jgi:hypothetical protein
MQFLKKNYEKILLGIVLAGLVVIAVFLLFLVANEKERLNTMRIGIISRSVKPLPPPEGLIQAVEEFIKRADSPMALDLTSTNKLFNPVRWQKAADGHIFPNPKGSELEKVEILKITPLYLTITLDQINASESGTRYAIALEQQTITKVSQRRRMNYYSPGDKKDLIVLREVRGPTNNPTALILELTDTGEQVSVAKDKPFQRVDGYTADLKYVPDNKPPFVGRRANDPVTGKITIAGTDYNIVAIGKDDVVLSEPSGKKTTIKYNSAP